MRLIVFSDSHGRYAPLDTIVERHREEDPLFLHLGDGEHEFDLLRTCFPECRFRYVRGNCDYGLEYPDYDILTVEGVTLLYTHGARFGVKGSLGRLRDFALSQNARIALFGHTHQPHEEWDGGLLLFNPGSVSLPRSGAPGYGVIDIQNGQIFPHHAAL